MADHSVAARTGGWSAFTFHKGEDMPDLVIRAQKNEDAEQWPEAMPCDCGGTQSLVSIEDGYVCDNADCIMYRRVA